MVAGWIRRRLRGPGAKLGRPSDDRARLIYRLLFQTATSTLLRFGRDPRHLGGDLGGTAVLHTSSRTAAKRVRVHWAGPWRGMAPAGFPRGRLPLPRPRPSAPPHPRLRLPGFAPPPAHDRIPVHHAREGFSPTGFIRHARRTTDKSLNVGQTGDVYSDNDDSSGPVRFSATRCTAYCGRMPMRLAVTPLAIAVALLLHLVAPLAGEAQQPREGHRIGILVGSSASFVTPYIETFRQALRGLGYLEGQNIAFEYRYAEGNYERLPILAADLVRIKVDVIVTEGTPPSRAAKQATRTIPIVMAATGDPIVAGLVANLARPGGNLTGASFFFPEIAAKRLELLKEAVPGVTVSCLSGIQPMQPRSLRSRRSKQQPRR